MSILELLVPIAIFAVGIFLLVKGGDLFVDGSVWVSEVSGIPRAVIGATLVSFATTAPEFTVSIIAIIQGSNDMSVGNAVGSLIANLGIAFALLAVFTPGKIGDKLYGVKGAIMLLSAIMLLVFCMSGTVNFVEGLLLFLVFFVSMFINIKYSKDAEENRSVRRPTDARDITVNVVRFLVGIGAIILGSDFIVDNGQILARMLGVSEAVIGLTVVAVGTSLPEVVTSISAIIKKENSLSIGNIVGANILDSTLILATGAFISADGLAVSRSTWTVDLPVTIVLMCIAVIPSVIGKRVYRWQGAAMFAIYVGYLAVLFK